MLLSNCTDLRSFIISPVSCLLVDKFDLSFVLTIVRDAIDDGRSLSSGERPRYRANTVRIMICFRFTITLIFRLMRYCIAPSQLILGLGAGSLRLGVELVHLESQDLVSCSHIKYVFLHNL